MTCCFDVPGGTFALIPDDPQARDAAAQAMATRQLIDL